MLGFHGRTNHAAYLKTAKVAAGCALSDQQPVRGDQFAVFPLMTATLLSAAGRLSRPWKNGGGETRDVFISPPFATLDGFDWRLSLADVTEPGPFSAFPGVHRTLCVLEGELELQVEGTAPQRLLPHSLAVSFPGDIAVFGRPVGGPARDLNLMVRRATHVGSIHKLVAGPTPALLANVCTQIIFAIAPMTVRLGAAEYALQRYDALMFSPKATYGEPIWSSLPAIGVTLQAG